LWPHAASSTFDSLSRVLFTVRSLYLCTIGPVIIFSLDRDTPARSSCNAKKLYSLNIQPIVSDSHSQKPTGLSPCMARRFHAHLSGMTTKHKGRLLFTLQHCPVTSRVNCQSLGWILQIFAMPVHSPLLGQSQLFSFPPPTDMLKLGGSPHLSQGPCSNKITTISLFWLSVGEAIVGHKEDTAGLLCCLTLCTTPFGTSKPKTTVSSIELHHEHCISRIKRSARPTSMVAKQLGSPRYQSTHQPQFSGRAKFQNRAFGFAHASVCWVRDSIIAVCCILCTWLMSISV
jgi:hypothetical protein